MNEESSLARNKAAFACSTASPNLPMGMCTMRRSFFSGVSRKFISKGVCKGPLMGRVYEVSEAQVLSVELKSGSDLRAQRVDPDAFASVDHGQLSCHRQNSSLRLSSVVTMLASCASRGLLSEPWKPCLWPRIISASLQPPQFTFLSAHKQSGVSQHP